MVFFCHRIQRPLEKSIGIEGKRKYKSGGGGKNKIVEG